MTATAFKPATVIAEYADEMPAEWFRIEVKDELVVKRARQLPGGKDSEDVESE